mmetsp:Transcript_36628/g.112862  ORF Transcript_36628/g.112862 Transcript_36628/m.112862 type:complete len:202 (+) Transcript_36628:1255-1860(+)
MRHEREQQVLAQRREVHVRPGVRPGLLADGGHGRLVDASDDGADENAHLPGRGVHGEQAKEAARGDEEPFEVAAVGVDDLPQVVDEGHLVVLAVRQRRGHLGEGVAQARDDVEARDVEGHCELRVGDEGREAVHALDDEGRVEGGGEDLGDGAVAQARRRLHHLEHPLEELLCDVAVRVPRDGVDEPLQRRHEEQHVGAAR